MSEAEQNTQRIMTELLAAHACIKRMLAENEAMLQNMTELDRMIGEQRFRIGAVEFDNARLRVALHNLVDACFKADNNGELSSEIDGSLMNAAWEALK